MQWPWNMSDAEFVRRVDRFQSRWRRPVAILMVVFSAAFVGLGIYFFCLIDAGLFPLFPDETTQTSFRIGVLVGYVGGKCVFFALFSLFSGLYWLFARRKDLLLVTYRRRLVELGELEDGAQR